ncbi:MAG: hypothetical protein HOP10_05660 [Chitinophagaceae bacterium]|nr:hypothetical protein [Chitinophagaceae bacterium]
MKKLFFIFLLLIIANSNINSQEVSDVLAINNHLYDRLSIRQTPLFNKEEIKTRSISSCMIVENRYDSRVDTLYIFNFDKDGNIEREVKFYNGYMAHRDTIYGRRSEKSYFNRIDSTVELSENKRVVTKYYVWAFNWPTEEQDTGHIKKITYDEKGRMISYKMNGTEDFHKINFCGTGITFNNEYRYDEKDRLIYFRDMYWRKYVTYEHHQNHFTVRLYDSLTNKMETKFNVFVNRNKDRIIEKDDFLTTLTRLSSGSNLFSRITRVQRKTNYNQSHYSLVYEYYDKPPSDQKPLITKSK